ncbi:MAG: AAA family ATPase [Planctomycetaceae bacterium]
MYEAYWKMNTKPFSYRVDSANLYRSQTLQSSALRLRYCFENNAGAALLLGVSGVGKSSLLQKLRADDDHLAPFIHLSFPTLSPAELTHAIAVEILGDEPAGDLSTDTLLLHVQRKLHTYSEQGQHAVIAFDEAHLLSNDSLNHVVLPLLNLVDTDHRLSLSVVLSGQPSLVAKIARNAQLRERIAVTATMDRFTDNEIRQYIDARLKAVGASTPVFTEGAVDAIIQLSQGNPRRINRLCDMALLVGYADQISQITDAEVRSLSAEILPAAA